MSDVIIYLHGFLSSPQSVKAQQTRQFVQAHYPGVTLEIPALPNTPDTMIDVLEEIVARHAGKPLNFIGSSMGGFLSTYLTERFGGKAVLINPAVKPFELFRDYLGERINPYTQQRFTLTPEHVDMIRDMAPEQISNPDDYWVLLQEGDETLDYRKAVRFYEHARQTVEPGGDHSFQGYDRYLPEILTFLLGADHEACSQTA